MLIKFFALLDHSFLDLRLSLQCLILLVIVLDQFMLLCLEGSDPLDGIEELAIDILKETLVNILFRGLRGGGLSEDYTVSKAKSFDNSSRGLVLDLLVVRINLTLDDLEGHDRVDV